MKETLATIELGGLAKHSELSGTYISDGGGFVKRFDPQKDWFGLDLEHLNEVDQTWIDASSLSLTLPQDFVDFRNPHAMFFRGFKSIWPSPLTPDVAKVFAELVQKWYSLA